MQRLLLVLAFCLIGAVPASAGTVVCVFYETVNGNVVEVLFPGTNSECDSMNDNTAQTGPFIGQLRFPLAMFDADSTSRNGQLAIVAMVQDIVEHHVRNNE